MKLIEWILSLFKTPKVEEKQTGNGVTRKLAWGAKVSPAFRDKVFGISEQLQINPDYLMACMAWESAETFSPSVKNMAGSGATGLIQFMPSTALHFFFSAAEIEGMSAARKKQAGIESCARLARMTAVEQLDYVRLYFKPYQGRVKTLSDVYMAILWPAGIGKPESHVLWRKGTHPTTYRQNAGLDSNADHDITKAEAAAQVQAKLVRGRQAQFIWVES